MTQSHGMKIMEQLDPTFTAVDIATNADGATSVRICRRY